MFTKKRFPLKSILFQQTLKPDYRYVYWRNYAYVACWGGAHAINWPGWAQIL